MSKLYGVPLSPPFRAVAWTMLQKKIPFKVQVTVPGATNKMGTLNEAYLSKSGGRSDRVPLLETEDGLCVTESPAILAHLCEKDSFRHYAQPASKEKALIDAYMHWHHENTRQIAKLTMPYTRPDLKVKFEDSEIDKIHAILKRLDTAWLGQSQFLGGTGEASIADILAYEEVAQASFTGALSLSDYSSIKEWTEKMESLPFHDQAHKSLVVLGNLVKPADDTPIMKRLGAATKEGMAALADAQKEYE